MSDGLHAEQISYENLGDRHDRPRPKLESDLQETNVQTKGEGSEWERNRYLGRSDPAQATYFEVSIEEPLDIPIRVNKCYDPPVIPTREFPDRSLEMNICSVESARKLHQALGNALEVYDQHEGEDSA